MLDITKDIQSLTTFRRRSGDSMKQLQKFKRPVVFTVKGKAAAIVRDAEAYQRLLDIAALEETKALLAAVACARPLFSVPVLERGAPGAVRQRSRCPALRLRTTGVAAWQFAALATDSR